MNVGVHYSQHNIVLKYIRMLMQKDGRDEMVFDNEQPIEIAHCYHDKGTEYSFDEGSKKTEWHWHVMVAHLREADMAEVVRGEAGSDGNFRSRGLVSCKVLLTSKYDHKVAHAKRKQGTVVSGRTPGTYEFVLERGDGSVVCLHPSFSKKNVTARYTIPQDDWEVPDSGVGGTSGKGTYQAFINKGVDCHMMFDTTKGGLKGYTQTSAVAASKPDVAASSASASASCGAAGTNQKGAWYATASAGMPQPPILDATVVRSSLGNLKPPVASPLPSAVPPPPPPVMQPPAVAGMPLGAPSGGQGQSKGIGFFSLAFQ